MTGKALLTITSCKLVAFDKQTLRIISFTFTIFDASTKPTMKRINIHDWLAMKPYDQKVSTDFYYLKIANSIRKTITGKQIQTINKY